MARSFKNTSTIVPKPEDAIKAGVPENDIGVYCQQKYRLAFGITSWYNQLSTHTFKTEFVQLDVNDVNALLSLTDANGNVDTITDAEILELLSSLTKRIDTALSNFDNGVFIKLDSRSPKDALSLEFDDDNVKQSIVDEIKRLSKCNDDAKPTVATKEALSGLLIALAKTSRITTGKQAICLLGQSRRVREDLMGIHKLLQYGLSTCIVLRAWDDVLVEHPEREFRGFVCNNKLNALSQYDYLTCYESLVTKKDHLQQVVKSAFEKHFKQALSNHENYVIDFYVDNNDNVYIIELNSFESWTGGCLFSWSKDIDVIVNGPLEFRLVTKDAPKHEHWGMIPRPWQTFILTQFNVCLDDISIPKHNDTSKTSNQSTCIIA
mmetsp:Transcript_9499/g.10498  ORF Transcript_9499/g.10498 Transcript_9499/m.10498 type:complete len:378 (-) Transcript_9499:58-1191(-)